MATARFYRDVLGFEIAWTYGDPPNFGAVRFGDAEIFLGLQPELSRQVDGHQHWFAVDDADALYEDHRRRSANIVEPLEDKPWGGREYVVRDPNGYRLRFSGPAKYKRPATALESMPAYIRIDPRLPTMEEYIVINDRTGWDKKRESIPGALAGSLCGVVATDTRDGKVIGCARTVGDGVRFIYVQDVMVMPEYQHRKIGSALMQCLMAELRRRYPAGASVYLFTGSPGFYEPFGFRREAAGMLTSL